MASFVSTYVFYLAALQFVALAAYLIIGLKRTKNRYMLLVPVLKIVCSYTEILGMIDGFFTKDYGHE